MVIRTPPIHCGSVRPLGDLSTVLGQESTRDFSRRRNGFAGTCGFFIAYIFLNQTFIRDIEKGTLSFL